MDNKSEQLAGVEGAADELCYSLLLLLTGTFVTVA
jgi:hypothetical protein